MSSMSGLFRIREVHNIPELNVAFFSFVLHFVWEFLQVPAFAGMADMRHWDGILLCTEATIGDVGLALTAFWSAALIARSRYWMMQPRFVPSVVFLGVGIGLTVGLEYYYTEITGRWAYADIMPLVPPFGTGLSPFAQWIVVPTMIVFIVGRQIRPRYISGHSS